MLRSGLIAKGVAVGAIGFLLAGSTALAAGSGRPGLPPGRSAGQWTSAGQNLGDSRDQPSEHVIGANNVNQLKVKWTFTTHGDVSATPAVAGGIVYFTDFGGYVNAVNAKTGRAVWSHKVADYLVSDSHGPQDAKDAGYIARDTPAISGGLAVFGVQHPFKGKGDGADVIAVDARTGALRWVTRVARHPMAMITGNPVIYGNTVYVGVSSSEEGAAANPNYPCCSFRGSVVALDLHTGKLLWKTYAVPANTTGNPADGYSGAAVWDTPAVSPNLGLVFVGTGNNYDVPPAVKTCVLNAQAAGHSIDGCTAANDHFESVLALNARTGAIVWAHKVSGYDAWTVACFSGGKWCPNPAGPDYDFGGSGPNLYTTRIGGRPTEVVGIGQKSGIYWAFNAANGSPLWSTSVGPGSALGGIEWGTAYDGKRIYAAVANYNHQPVTLPSGQTTTNGLWAALDPATGRILWQTADPGTKPALAVDIGPVSTANGVVYGGSLNGHMYALDAATGKILWSYQSDGSVGGGPSIVGRSVFWGSGYGGVGTIDGNAFSGKDSKTFYAFSLPKPTAGGQAH